MHPDASGESRLEAADAQEKQVPNLTAVRPWSTVSIERLDFLLKHEDLCTLGFRACVATAMMIFYLARMVGNSADVSYNTAWGGIWAFAEISLGITVSSMLLLPKFIEAKGTKLRGLFSILARSLTSLTSWEQSKKDTTTPQEVRLDTFSIIGNSESDLVPTNHEQDVERCPSYDDVHREATATPHRYRSRC